MEAINQYIILVWLHIFTLSNVFSANINASNEGWSWDRILRSRQPIIANGNVWPPSPEESALHCLLLLTSNQIMWHCPSTDNETYERTVLYRGNNGRFQGAFMAQGVENRRIWVLKSAPKQDKLLELDTITGEIMQTLVIEGSLDGHDAVLVGNSVFVVDTRHGQVIELELPASKEPYFESSIRNGAKVTKQEGYTTIIKRHTGFTRADHINNVAVHPDLLISNLHGKGAIKAKVASTTTAPSPSRLSALSRNIPEGDGRELNAKEDGFNPVFNVGNWCHGIAFWEDMGWNGTDSGESQIKLISLDSKAGTLVSVVLSGPNYGDREVLWEPDLTHPVLVPPHGITKAYYDGAMIFSKGLAVQSGVAYFGVSYARAPPLRKAIPESLLVAVDISTKTEIWVRTIRSNGLINQILVKTYLGEVSIPAELPSIELTYHGLVSQSVNSCTDFEVPEGLSDEMCQVIEAMKEKKQKFWKDECREKNYAAICCCICSGGQNEKIPLIAGKLDEEILAIKENVTATATFVPRYECLDKEGWIKHSPLAMKTAQNGSKIKTIDDNLDNMVKYLCSLEVGPLRKMVVEIGDEGFTYQYQHRKGNAILRREKLEPGISTIFLVFSSKDANLLYYFPWLSGWLPKIQECLLTPLGIPLNKILQMQIANVPRGTNMRFHKDENAWSQNSHRVHIPIVTHAGVFFMLETKPTNSEDNQTLRIKSNQGEVYEVNNKLSHAVRNIGPSSIHIIIDWVEEPLYDEEEFPSGKTRLIKLLPGDYCTYPQGYNELQCKLREEL